MGPMEEPGESRSWLGRASSRGNGLGNMKVEPQDQPVGWIRLLQKGLFSTLGALQKTQDARCSGGPGWVRGQHRCQGTQASWAARTLRVSPHQEGAGIPWSERQGRAGCVRCPLLSPGHGQPRGCRVGRRAEEWLGTGHPWRSGQGSSLLVHPHQGALGVSPPRCGI